MNLQTVYPEQKHQKSPNQIKFVDLTRETSGNSSESSFNFFSVKQQFVRRKSESANQLQEPHPPQPSITHSVRGGLCLLAAGASPVQVKQEQSRRTGPRYDSSNLTTNTDVTAGSQTSYLCHTWNYTELAINIPKLINNLDINRAMIHKLLSAF